ncbi:MAG TPA: hypothetical protein VN457_06335, partial [Chlamydiales bacterium]|nr:hypothetical protein [Chlamydiales bacterium]
RGSEPLSQISEFSDVVKLALFFHVIKCKQYYSEAIFELRLRIDRKQGWNDATLNAVIQAIEPIRSLQELWGWPPSRDYIGLCMRAIELSIGLIEMEGYASINQKSAMLPFEAVSFLQREDAAGQLLRGRVNCLSFRSFKPIKDETAAMSAHARQMERLLTLECLSKENRALIEEVELPNFWGVEGERRQIRVTYMYHNLFPSLSLFENLRRMRFFLGASGSCLEVISPLMSSLKNLPFYNKLERIVLIRSVDETENRPLSFSQELIETFQSSAPITSNMPFVVEALFSDPFFCQQCQGNPEVVRDRLVGLKGFQLLDIGQPKLVGDKYTITCTPNYRK